MTGTVLEDQAAEESGGHRGSSGPRGNSALCRSACAERPALPARPRVCLCRGVGRRAFPTPPRAPSASSGVAGSCGGWAASSSPGRRQERTRVFQNTPPSVHGELLLETSNFTDHGFGGKNVTPEVSGKLFTPGEMEMSRQMGQAPYWIPGRFTQRPAQPAPPPPRPAVSQPQRAVGNPRALCGVFLPRPLPRCLPCPALLPHTLHDRLPLCLNATTPKPSLNPGLAGRPCSLLAGSILM